MPVYFSGIDVIKLINELLNELVKQEVITMERAQKIIAKAQIQEGDEIIDESNKA